VFVSRKAGGDASEEIRLRGRPPQIAAPATDKVAVHPRRSRATCRQRRSPAPDRAGLGEAGVEGRAYPEGGADQDGSGQFHHRCAVPSSAAEKRPGERGEVEGGGAGEED